MSILNKLFGNSYDDERIVLDAERAIAEDPIIAAPGGIGVTSDKGAVTLFGRVNSEREKTHIENLVKTTLDNHGIKYQQIDNQLSISAG
jgi:osmotically-inducible protein OsmY